MRIFACAALVVAACGGGGSSSDPDAKGSGSDAAPPGSDAPPACVEPTTTVAPADPDSFQQYAHGLTLLSNGNVALYYQDASASEVARIWDGTMWATHDVYGPPSGFFGSDVATEIDGRATLFSTIDDGTSDGGNLRYWEQLASGDFATGTRIPSVSRVEATAARYDATTKVLSVAGDDESNTIYSFERNAGGTWTVETVANVPSPSDVSTLGVGTLADGTAAIAAATETSTGSALVLYRRASGTWHLLQTFATGAHGTAFEGRVDFPPAGATAEVPGIALYDDPSTSHVRGLFFDRTTGAPTGTTELVPMSSQFTEGYASVAFAPDGNSGKILIVTGNNAPYLVSFEDGQFAPAQELRPDLVFDGAPQLFYHPCGDFLILHASRAPSDAPDSAPLMLEPLQTFME